MYEPHRHKWAKRKEFQYNAGPVFIALRCYMFSRVDLQRPSDRGVEKCKLFPLIHRPDLVEFGLGWWASTQLSIFALPRFDGCDPFATSAFAPTSKAGAKADAAVRELLCVFLVGWSFVCQLVELKVSQTSDSTQQQKKTFSHQEAPAYDETWHNATALYW